MRFALLGPLVVADGEGNQAALAGQRLRVPARADSYRQSEEEDGHWMWPALVGAGVCPERKEGLI